MLTSQGHDIVPLTINDVVLGLRLETANEESSLTKEAVAELDLETEPSGRAMGGTGGFSHYRITHVRKFRLGPGELDDGAFVVPTESSMNADLAPASGALGSDIPNNFDLDLQASMHTLRLYKPQACGSVSPPWGGPYQSVETDRRPVVGNVPRFSTRESPRRW